MTQLTFTDYLTETFELCPLKSFFCVVVPLDEELTKRQNNPSRQKMCRGGYAKCDIIPVVINGERINLETCVCV